MSAFNGAVLTAKGLLLQNKAQTGVELRMTRIAVGSGGYTGDLSSLTALRAEEKTLPIQSINIDEGKTKIRAVLDNSDVTTGFYIKELGLFANDPDEGEILYAVANSGEGPADYIPPKNSDVVEEVIDFLTLVGNASNVTAVIDKSIVYPTFDDFNKMKSNLTAEIENYKKIVDVSMHSGFLKMGKIDYDHKVANTLKVGESVVNVAGNIIHLPAQEINIGQAPSKDFINVQSRKGVVNKLILLEVWKSHGLDESNIQLNHRIRVVNDVPKGTYKGKTFEGLIRTDGYGFYSGHYEPSIVMGGNSDVIQFDNKSSKSKFMTSFNRTDLRDDYPLNDMGLLIAGYENQESKELLKSEDGFVYALPLYIIECRNEEGYSIENPNGSRRIETIGFIVDKVSKLNEITEFTLSATDYEKVELGRYYYETSDTSFIDVLEILPNNKVKVIPGRSEGSTAYNIGTWKFYLESGRPDKKFALQIYKSDIFDLRRSVKVGTLDTKILLESSMQDAFSGRLTSQKMVKHYLGVKKATTDEHTVFYASLDGTVNAEIGNELIGSGSPVYIHTCTGLGLLSDENKVYFDLVNVSPIEGTLDFFVDNSLYNKRISWSNALITLATDDNTKALSILAKSDEDILKLYSNTNPNGNYDNYISCPQGIGNKELCHVRITWKLHEKLMLYINGNQVGSFDYIKPMLQPTKLYLGSYIANTNEFAYYNEAMGISDIHISKINRGSTFSNLPEEVILSEAKIAPKFTYQRSNYGSPLTSIGITKIIPGKADSSKDGRDIVRNQSVDGKWSQGDKIRIMGEGRSVITGKLDSDSKISNVLKQDIGNKILILEDRSALSDDDVIMICDHTNKPVCEAKVKLSSVDNAIELYHVDYGTRLDVVETYDYIYEITALNSSPILLTSLKGTVVATGNSQVTLPNIFSSSDDAYNGYAIEIVDGLGKGQRREIIDYTGASKEAMIEVDWDVNPDNASKFVILGKTFNIVGTWTGLGTKEAVFTVGSMAGISGYDDGIFDLELHYTANYPEHEVQTPVYDEILEAHVKDQVLRQTDVLRVVDDFKGKVKEDYAQCPHIAKATGAPDLYLPKEFKTIFSSTSYGNIAEKNGNLAQINTTTNGNRIQKLFSFDIVRMIEDKFGEIPALDKIGWLKENIDEFRVDWSGYGTGPNGNKAQLELYNATYKRWGQEVSTSYGSVVTLRQYDLNVSNNIDADGFIHVIVHADPSDGVAASTLYTDYITAMVKLKTAVDYDIIAPVNERRDAGLTNVLLVKKSTREMLIAFNHYYEENVSIIANISEKYPQFKFGEKRDIEIIAQLPYFICTDLNSATGNKIGLHPWGNLAWKVGLDDLPTIGEVGYSELSLAVDSIGINTGKKISVKDYGFYSGYAGQRSLKAKPIPMIGINCLLVLENDEIKLMVYAEWSDTGEFKLGNHTSGHAYLIPIKGRPLLKGFNSVELDTLSDPKAWQTSSEQLQGIVDKLGKVIVS